MNTTDLFFTVSEAERERAAAHAKAAAAEQSAAREAAAREGAAAFDAAVAQRNWALAKAQADVLMHDFPGTEAAKRVTDRPSFIKLTNPQASAGMSGTYGITWPHRFTK